MESYLGKKSFLENRKSFFNQQTSFSFTCHYHSTMLKSSQEKKNSVHSRKVKKKWEEAFKTKTISKKSAKTVTKNNQKLLLKAISIFVGLRVI